MTNTIVAHSMAEAIECKQKFFDNLIWLTTEEAAQYLRKSVNAIRILVFRKVLRARKFRRRLYFRKSELEAVIEASQLERG